MVPNLAEEPIIPTQGGSLTHSVRVVQYNWSARLGNEIRLSDLWRRGDPHIRTEPKNTAGLAVPAMPTSGENAARHIPSTR